MKFKDSLLFHTLSVVAGVYLQHSVYHAILATPLVLVFLIIGVPLSIICDAVLAMCRVKS